MPSRGLASCGCNERGYGTAVTGPHEGPVRVEIDTPRGVISGRGPLHTRGPGASAPVGKEGDLAV